MIVNSPVVEFIIAYKLWLLPDLGKLLEKDPRFVSMWTTIAHTAPWYATGVTASYFDSLEQEDAEYKKYDKDAEIIDDKALALWLDDDDVFDEVLIASYNTRNEACLKRIPKAEFYEDYIAI